MKGQKNKHQNQQGMHNHPTIFSISIFQSPQEFLAVYLALQSENEEHKMNAGRYLEGLLHRTKSPPIALTYTKEFTLLKSESQIQLTIIRFISQLSDLSAGKSMQSSLSYIIDNSSFLTELRHNLTHRVMVKGLVIERGKQMILKELKEKYWKIMFEKVWKTYFIDNEKVEEIFGKIVSSAKLEKQEQSNFQNFIQKSSLYRQYLGELQNQETNKLSFNYLFKNCQSNYEFKSLLRGYVVRRMLPELIEKYTDTNENEESGEFKIDKEIVNKYLSIQNIAETSNFSVRSMIIFSTLLDVLLSIHKHNQLSNLSQTRQILSQIIIVLINQLSSLSKNKTKINNKDIDPLQALCSPIVIKKLRQIYLLKYIDEYRTLVDSLPEEIISQIKRFWQQKQNQIGKQLLIDF